MGLYSSSKSSFRTFHMPNPTHGSPTPAAPIEIAILFYPGAQTAMIHGITDLLTTASAFSSRDGGPVLRVGHWHRSAKGPIGRTFVAGDEGSDPPTLVVVPGRLAGPVDTDEAAPYVEWLRQCHDDGATLASNCGGAFLLAETGLLEGRPATTHWQIGDAFRERFPSVRLDTDRLLIDDGDIITAGGLMAWTSLGLRLVERLLGQAPMLEAAQFFLIDVAGREQRHHSRFVPPLDHDDEPILRVQRWLAESAGNDVAVSDMARHASMEERTFLRRFKRATGMAPSEYAQRLRIDTARELLQTTRQPVKQVAWRAGYGDAATFGRLFRRTIGLSPGEYRRRFGAAR